MLKELLHKYPGSVLFGWLLVALCLLITLILLLSGHFTPFVFVLLLPGLASLLYGWSYSRKNK